ncbi:hypothetical protein ACHAW6_010691, partial [Cyclotella cf. meneghiniana]
MNSNHPASNELGRPSATAASDDDADDDDPWNEALFHSCISATGFQAESDAINFNRESQTNSEDDNVGGFRISNEDSKSDADDIAAAPNEEQPLRDAVESTNESSRSHSSSSWNHLPPKDAAQTAKVNSINFDRNRTCLILSTSRGVRIRTLKSLHHDDATNDERGIFDIAFRGGVTYAQFLPAASLLAMIPPNSPRCCFLYDVENATNALAALPMSAAVKRVEFTTKVLVCVTADGRLHVFRMNHDTDRTKEHGRPDDVTTPLWIQTLNILHPSDSLRNITRGTNIFFSGAYFDLSPHESEPYLVCKSFNGTPGTIRVYDPTRVTEVEISSPTCANSSLHSGDGISAAASASSRTHSASAAVPTRVRRRCHLHATIDAHEHPVARMLIGSGGGRSSFLATASARGTAIRVFGLPHGEQLWEWHRGSRSCQILSLAWNGPGDRLVSYGSSGTVHVFEWNRQQPKKNGQPFSRLEQSHGDVRDFEEVKEDRTPTRSTNHTTGLGATSDSQSDKPLYKRIGASIRRHTVGGNNAATPLKKRSFAKLKYPHTGSMGAQQQQHLIVALLDKQDSTFISGSSNTSESSREDTVVTCTLTGELRQYSVKLDGSFKVTDMEDVLFGGANNVSPPQT